MARALFATILLLLSLSLVACGGGSGTTAPTPPVIASIEPASGGLAGGTEVVIKGERFLNSGPGANDVLIGGNPADQVAIVDDQTIQCRTPVGVAGPADVSVTKNHGTAVLAGGFTYYPPPTLTSITPDEGTRLGGTPITVTGTGFLNNNPVETKLLIGLKEAKDIVVVDDETITALTPDSFTEVAKDVVVVNNNGQAVEPLGFTYFGPTPLVYQVIPTEGPAGGGVAITIIGEYYTLNGGVLTVTFGSVQAANVQRVDDQTITCVSPAGPPAQFVDVSVGNVNGTSTLVDAYYNIPPPPTLSGLDPSRGVMSDPTPVTITGTGFVNYGAGTNTVMFGSQAGTSVVAVNDTTITCIAPTVTSPQFVTVSVTNNNGTGSLTDGFEYFKPPMWAASGCCSGGGLYKIDTSTWTATPVGSTSYGLTGLAIDPSTGTMYGWRDRCSGAGLCTIDKTTGAATYVGGSGNYMGDITIYPSGSSWKLYGYTVSSYNFVEINTTTGGATSQSYMCCYWWGNGYASDKNGNTYFANGSTLYSVNPTSGSMTTIGSTGRYTQSLTFHDGVLYGEESWGSDSLYSISTSNGSSSVVMTLSGSIDSIASEFP